MIIGTIEIPDTFITANLSDKSKADLLLRWEIKQRMESKPDEVYNYEIYSEIKQHFRNNGHLVCEKRISNIWYEVKKQ